MIHSKIPLLAAAVGAAATFGFVWLGRRSRQRAFTAPVQSAFDPDDAARDDALHDLAAEPGETEFDVETELDVLDASDGELAELEGVEFQSLEEEALSKDEPYDAVDPESIGAEFLRRATEADVPTGDSAQPPRFAEAVDMAVELPVGRIDGDGNTELHATEEPRGPEPELSPNDEELSARHGAEPDRGGTSNSNG